MTANVEDLVLDYGRACMDQDGERLDSTRDALLAEIRAREERARREGRDAGIEEAIREVNAMKQRNAPARDRASTAMLAAERALARPRSEDAPCDSTFTCRDGWHEIGCSKRPPAPVCTCKMPIGFGRSFRGFMAPDPNCAACSRPRSEETP